MGFPGGSEVKASACNAGDLGSIPGLRRSPGEENGNPFHYCCLENSMDKGAWWARVHGVTKELDKTWWLNNSHNNHVYMSIPVSQFISSLLPPSVSICLLLHLGLYFCFANKFICIIFPDSTYGQYCMIFVFLFLTSLCMTDSRSIHIFTNDPIFVMAE